MTVAWGLPAPGRGAWLLSGCLCGAAAYAVLAPLTVCACVTAAALGVGPAGAVVFSCTAWGAVILFCLGMNVDGISLCLALCGAWSVLWLMRRFRRHAPVPKGHTRFGEIVVLTCSGCGAVLLLGAACIRSESWPEWAGCGALLLAVGLGQEGGPGVWRRNYRRVVRGAVEAAVVAAISLLLVEGFVRVAGALGGGTENVFGWAANRPITVPHTRRYFTPARNMDCEIPFQKDKDIRSSYRYHLSGLGLRGPDYGPKEENEFRIVLLGDSFAFGWALNEGDTIARVLENMLRKACPAAHVTVINAGVPGYSIWQERDLLNEVIMPLAPDHVVHVIFPTNDLDGAWERKKTFPRTYGPAWRRILEPYMHRDDWRYRLEDALAAHWQTLAVVRRRFPERMGQPVVDALSRLRFLPELRIPKQPQSDRRPWGFVLNRARLDPDEAAAFEEMCAEIRGTREDCMARGIGYTAAVLPFPTDFYDEDWRKGIAGHETDQYEKGREVVVTEQCLGEAGIETVDVYHPLLTANRDGQTHYRYDGHLNPRGARIVAEAVRDRLISKFPGDRCTIQDHEGGQEATYDKER